MNFVELEIKMKFELKPKFVSRLQIVFWVLGWATLALTLMKIGMSAFQHFQPAAEFEIIPRAPFIFLLELQKLFSGIGEAFFAFLVSAVFGMVYHRKPIGTQRNERFLLLACVGFLAESLLGALHMIRLGFQIIPDALNSNSGTEYIASQIISYFLFFAPSILSSLYAITIFVLFRHFAQLVTFESEVV